MKTINVRYIELIDRVIIEHYDGEHISYPLDDNRDKVNIDEAMILLQELFQADIKRLTKEYNEAEAMLRAIYNGSYKIPKKTKWIFRKDLFIKALGYDNNYPLHWVNVADGCEAKFVKDTDSIGYITTSDNKTLFVLKSWCEEVE